MDERELIIGVEGRHERYARRWLARPEFRAALHRLDSHHSLLAEMSEEDRKFVLSDQGPEAAGKPGEEG